MHILLLKLSMMHLALKTNKHCVTRRVSEKKAANQCPSRKFSSAGDKHPGTKIGRASAQLIKDIPHTLKIKSRSLPLHKLIAGAECIKYEFAFESSAEARGASCQ
jgi:hypothetical protein